LIITSYGKFKTTKYLVIESVIVKAGLLLLLLFSSRL